jgi:hypothetical protein
MFIVVPVTVDIVVPVPMNLAVHNPMHDATVGGMVIVVMIRVVPRVGRYGERCGATHQCRGKHDPCPCRHCARLRDTRHKTLDGKWLPGTARTIA